MSPRESDLALAGEYVLGLLPPAEQEAFELRLATDRTLALAVAAWRDRLHELDAAAPPIPPSPDLWAKIEGAVEAPPGVAAASPAPSVRTPERAKARPSLFAGLWESLTLWRGVGLAGAAASVALGLVLVAAPKPRAPIAIAVLLTSDGVPGAVVDIYADGESLVAPLQDVSVPDGRTLQVWTLPDVQRGPVSLGLMPRAARTRLASMELPAPKPRQLYEITLEPAGGSPTARPTGPILYKGYAEPPR
ncbi:anti-sigma factor [Methylopila sp. 73B]|uniref:anti-sigma factor n=1 Tax=Methylopila sp. 73B TaxID=1120792 RepID=UPI00037CCD8A|nr:anti-sigma factor [Methylopila sp. 73B]